MSCGLIEPSVSGAPASTRSPSAIFSRAEAGMSYSRASCVSKRIVSRRAPRRRSTIPSIRARIRRASGSGCSSSPRGSRAMICPASTSSPSCTSTRVPGVSS